MKEFVKTMLAVICGIFVFSVLALIFTFTMIGSIAAVGSAEPVMPREGVLVMDMSRFVLSEQSAPGDPFSMLQAQSAVMQVGIRDAVNAVNAAAADPAVKYIYLKTDNYIGGTLALTGELRKSLENFRQTSGKAVVAYTDMPTTESYYLASVSDKIYMSSARGMTNMMTGVASQLFFLKDLLDALGVNVQLIRHGKYKSAGEMFVRSSSSAENLEQNQRMIDSIWDSMAQDIAAGRSIAREALDAALNDLKLNNAEDFVKEGFADDLLSKEELKAKLADLAVAPSYKDVKFISFLDYVQVKSKPNVKAHQKIAVVYVDGEIVDGYDHRQVAGDRFAGILSEVRADSTVKAVVLRVNSPGGSVLAADKIRQEVELLKKDKPVVASYGDFAASGGYWISAGCDKIFANPLTLTGSIGVFSMIPEFGGTLRKVAHVNVTTVGSHKHSDVFTLMRPLDSFELDYMQRSVEDIYDAFVEVVSTGRRLDPEFVDSIAQGRVWTGSDALEISLVDETGTLEDAVRWAAAAAGNASVEAWNVVGYPAPQTQLEAVMQVLKPSENNVFAGTPMEGFGSAMLSWKRSVEKGGPATVFARLPYCIEF